MGLRFKIIPALMMVRVSVEGLLLVVVVVVVVVVVAIAVLVVVVEKSMEDADFKDRCILVVQVGGRIVTS